MFAGCCLLGLACARARNKSARDRPVAPSTPALTKLRRSGCWSVRRNSGQVRLRAMRRLSAGRGNEAGCKPAGSSYRNSTTHWQGSQCELRALRAGLARNSCLVPLPEAGRGLGGGVRARSQSSLCPVPPPRFGEGVRGWGLATTARRRPHPPGPPLRSGEGEQDKKW